MTLRNLPQKGLLRTKGGALPEGFSPFLSFRAPSMGARNLTLRVTLRRSRRVSSLNRKEEIPRLLTQPQNYRGWRNDTSVVTMSVREWSPKKEEIPHSASFGMTKREAGMTDGMAE